MTQRWTIAAVDDVSWSVGWDSDTDNSCSGLAECEFERMVHETRTCAQGPASRSASCVHSVVSERATSEDAVPELEDDAEPVRGNFGNFTRSTSSRSRSTGTGPFSPFTNTWSEIEMPSVVPSELPLPGTLTRPSPERSRGRHASKGSVSGGRQSSAGFTRSTSPSVEPLSPTSAERRGRKRMEGPRGQPPPTLGLELNTKRPKRAGSQPARHSTPWAMPSMTEASVGVSPALSVALPTLHDVREFVLKTGTASVRSRSVG
jgi:hypothetical protein